MRLELKVIDDRNIKVLSKNTGKHVGNIIVSIATNEWVFRPNDCGCVWAAEVIFELATTIQNMNK